MLETFQSMDRKSSTHWGTGAIMNIFPDKPFMAYMVW